MLPNEINVICREAFAEVLKDDSELQGRTWCFIDPFKDKTNNRHLTIADKATGFGSPIRLPAKHLPYMDKDIVKKILVKILDGVKIVIKKAENKGKPVDYQKNPVYAGGKPCMLDKVEHFASSTVEFYTWSSLFTK